MLEHQEAGAASRALSLSDLVLLLRYLGGATLPSSGVIAETQAVSSVGKEANRTLRVYHTVCIIHARICTSAVQTVPWIGL